MPRKGQKQKSKSRRRRFFPIARTYDGERYYLAGVTSNKQKAKSLQTQEKKKGKNARVASNPVDKKVGRTFRKGPRFVNIVEGRNQGKTGRHAVYSRAKNKSKISSRQKPIKIRSKSSKRSRK